jgi:hypothetical protein
MRIGHLNQTLIQIITLEINYVVLHLIVACSYIYGTICEKFKTKTFRSVTPALSHPPPGADNRFNNQFHVRGFVRFFYCSRGLCLLWFVFAGA